MMNAIDIQLLVVPDCPHEAAAEDLLRTALLDIGLPAAFQVVTITDEAARDFAGSPTFCAAGADLFPVVGKSTGLSCRIYRIGSGLSGLPDPSALRQALKRRADQAWHWTPMRPTVGGGWRSLYSH